MIKTLLKKEIRYNIKFLIAFMALLTMYNLIMTSMYDPVKQKTLESMMSSMGPFMKAFGMKTGAIGLSGFLGNYLYGFIMIFIPFIFDVILVHRLIGNYIDDGSMSYLLIGPHKRRNIILNQIFIMVTFISILLFYCLFLNVVYSNIYLPGKLDVKAMFMLVLGCLMLHLFLIGLTLFFSVLLKDTKKYLPLSIGLFLVMYLFQMVANFSDKFKKLGYLSYLSLFNATKILENPNKIQIGVLSLGILSLILFTSSIIIFNNKDMSL